MNTIANHAVTPFIHSGPNQRNAQTIGDSPSDDNRSQPKTGASTRSNGVHLTMSAQASTEGTHGKEVADRYSEAVDAIIEQQSSADASSKSTAVENAPILLSDLPPLKLFNQADVKAYEKQLMSELASRGIDTSQRIDLGIDYQGNVIVKNDHPDKEAIEATFQEDMDLRNGLVQTSNFYLFREIFALHQQWANRVDSGVSEKVANVWLIDAVGGAVSKSSQGLTFEDGVSQDPFASDKTASLAMKAYQS